MTADITWQRMIGFIAVALVALALTGCGVRGGLERPAPLWGAPEAQPDAEPDEDEEEDEDDFLDPDDWRTPG